MCDKYDIVVVYSLLTPPSSSPRRNYRGTYSNQIKCMRFFRLYFSSLERVKDLNFYTDSKNVLR